MKVVGEVEGAKYNSDDVPISSQLQVRYETTQQFDFTTGNDNKNDPPVC